MYERFTDRARKVMQLANSQAQKYNQSFIDTGLILLGLVVEGSGVAANVLKNLDVDLRKVQLKVERTLACGTGETEQTTGRLPHTPKAKKVLDYAIEESRRLNHNYVGTEHLLLGLFRAEEGIAAQVLTDLGLKIADIREEILNLLGQNLPDHKILTALQPNSAGIYPVTDLEAAEETTYSSARAAAESLTVYQIELINERIRLLNQQMKESVEAQDLVQAGRFRSEAEALSQLMVLYFWSRGHN